MVLKTRSCNLLTICSRSSPRDAMMMKEWQSIARCVRWREPTRDRQQVVGDQQIDWDETSGRWVWRRQAPILVMDPDSSGSSRS